MKAVSGAIVLGLCLLPSVAFAQRMTTDDVKWVNQCIRDNQGEPGATQTIIRAYCVCMEEKMPESETRSVTQWEKSHPAARRDCDRKSGWR